MTEVTFPERVCNKCEFSTYMNGQHNPNCEGELVYLHQILGKTESETVDLISDGKTVQTVEVRTTSPTGGQKGVKSSRFSLIPVGPLTSLAELYAKGAVKYSEHNWRKGYDWSKSIDSLFRHTTEWMSGKDLDTCPPDGIGCQHVTNDGEPFEGVPGVSCYNHTGSHHLDCAAFHVFTLREFADTQQDYDDRYKPKA